MSKTRFDILASAAQTATGQGGGISVSGIKNLALFAEATSVSGSLSTIYLQGSSDGGTTWFDMLAETALNLTSGTAAGTSTTWVRNILIDVTLGTGNIRKVMATYRIFGDYVRAAWHISGSGASSTFYVKGIGEN